MIKSIKNIIKKHKNFEIGDRVIHKFHFHYRFFQKKIAVRK